MVIEDNDQFTLHSQYHANGDMSHCVSTATAMVLT